MVLPAACDNQALVELRIMTTNAGGNDEYVGIDNINITGTQRGKLLLINDVSVTEGNSGTVTVHLHGQPDLSRLPLGGVTFEIGTSDGTATVADNDYVCQLRRSAPPFPRGRRPRTRSTWW